MKSAILALGLLAACGPAQSEKALCVDGHPRHRASYVSYGGLPPRHGFERDHIVPLCLGGADSRDNVQYQPWPDASIKDRREWAACEAFCRGQLSMERARAYVAGWREDR